MFAGPEIFDPHSNGGLPRPQRSPFGNNGRLPPYAADGQADQRGAVS